MDNSNTRRYSSKKSRISISRKQVSRWIARLFEDIKVKTVESQYFEHG
jgi:hypothetical protein